MDGINNNKEISVSKYRRAIWLYLIKLGYACEYKSSDYVLQPALTLAGLKG